MMQNEGRHIETIIAKTACGRHDAQIGVACFGISPESPLAPETLLGICNRRAIKAGANGKISDSSYRRAPINKR